jgi:hypothetical protein
MMMLARYIIVDELEKRTAESTGDVALLTQAYDDTIEAPGLGLKDVETEVHSQRVTAYTISIATTVPSHAIFTSAGTCRFSARHRKDGYSRQTPS